MVKIGGQQTAPLVSAPRSIPGGADILAGVSQQATAQGIEKVGKSLSNLLLTINDQNATAVGQEALTEIRAERVKIFQQAQDGAFLNQATLNLQVEDPDKKVVSGDGSTTVIGGNVDYDEFVMNKFRKFAQKKLDGINNLAAQKISGKIDNITNDLSEDVLRSMATIQRSERNKTFGRQIEIQKRTVDANPFLFDQALQDLIDLDEGMNLRIGVGEEGSKVAAELAYATAISTMKTSPENFKNLLNGEPGFWDGKGTASGEHPSWFDFLTSEQVNRLDAAADNKMQRKLETKREVSRNLLKNDIASVNATGIGHFENEQAYGQFLKTEFPDMPEDDLKNQMLIRKTAINTFADREKLKGMPLSDREAFLESHRPKPGDPDFILKNAAFSVLISEAKQQQKLMKEDIALWAEQVDPDSFDDEGMNLVEKITQRVRIYKQVGFNDAATNILSKNEVQAFALQINSRKPEDLVNFITNIGTQHDKNFSIEEHDSFFEQKYGNRILNEIASRGELTSMYRVLMGAVNDKLPGLSSDLQRAILVGKDLGKSKLDKDDLDSINDSINSAGGFFGGGSAYREWADAFLSDRIEREPEVLQMRDAIVTLSKLYMTEDDMGASEAASLAMQKVISSRVQSVDGEIIYPRSVVYRGDPVAVDVEKVGARLDELRVNFAPNTIQGKEFKRVPRVGDFFGKTGAFHVIDGANIFDTVQTYQRNAAIMTEDDINRSIKGGHFRSSADGDFLMYVIPMKGIEGFLPLLNSEGNTILWGLGALSDPNLSTLEHDIYQPKRPDKIRFNSPKEAKESKRGK